MLIIHYRGKVTRVQKCERCSGKGIISHDNWVEVIGYGRMNFGHAIMCGCRGGHRIDYPWTRGKSVTPLVGGAR